MTFLKDGQVYTVDGSQGFVGYIWKVGTKHMFHHVEEAYDPNGMTPADLRAVADKCEELDSE